MQAFEHTSYKLTMNATDVNIDRSISEQELVIHGVNLLESSVENFTLTGNKIHTFPFSLTIPNVDFPSSLQVRY